MYSLPLSSRLKQYNKTLYRGGKAFEDGFWSSAEGKISAGTVRPHNLCTATEAGFTVRHPHVSLHQSTHHWPLCLPKQTQIQRLRKI